MLINFKRCHKQFSLVNCYAPNDEHERQHWLNNLTTWINKKASNINNLVVCGDFNCCLRDNDRSTATQLKDKSRLSFSELIKNLQLIDHWDSRGTKISNFTWTDGKIYSRLDYILTNINNDIKIIKTYSETVIDD